MVYEWTGLYERKPKLPEWEIKEFRAMATGDKPHWRKRRYYYDTGGYEHLEVVRWMDLPPVEE